MESKESHLEIATTDCFQEDGHEKDDILPIDHHFRRKYSCYRKKSKLLKHPQYASLK